MPSNPLVIVLLGPTASGKTALSLGIAERLGLPVINVDSRQLYRGMDLGTAKPTAAQQARVPHHLLDLRPPDQPITLQEFQAEANPCIEATLQQEGMALLVGGSGLYLKALTNGLRPPAVPPQPQLRRQLDALGQTVCHRQATAEPPPWQVLELGLDPVDLRGRIQQRTEQLYNDGLVEETRRLAERYGDNLPLLQTIGYGEALKVMGGSMQTAEAIRITSQRTRQFAKRQRTWFRRQHNPHWLESNDSEAEAMTLIERQLR
jgi:tRNA dimethylallyltransferase